MKAYSLIIISICCICRYTSVKMKPELKRNILKFGYGINYKYEGMLVHFLDRLYVVTKCILPTIDDLKFSTIKYDEKCEYLQKEKGCTTEAKEHILGLIQYCRKIRPFVHCYRDQIDSFNCAAQNFLKKSEIGLILPQYTERKEKCNIITLLISGFIGLEYDGITSFLHYRRNKALRKAVKAMETKAKAQCNRLMHLEDSIMMYGVYNPETLEKLVNTVHIMCNNTTPNEKKTIHRRLQFSIYMICKSERSSVLYCKHSSIFKNA